MGYRTYLASMPKKEYNKIKSLTKEQFYAHFNKLHDSSDGDDEPYIAIYNISTELYEFGKYTNYQGPKKSCSTFFKKKELQERYEDEDYDLRVVTKEFLEYIINQYAEQIRKYYTDMLTPFFPNDTPHTFLNSIKTEYNHPNNKHTFNFDLITAEQQTALFKIIEHVNSFNYEWNSRWGSDTPFDLNKGPEITNSWKYEYAIFELVRIYKSFDWEKNVMIYYGY